MLCMYVCVRRKEGGDARKRAAMHARLSTKQENTPERKAEDARKKPPTWPGREKKDTRR